MSQVAVEICSRRFSFPLECPCCGALPDAELAIPFRPGRREMAEDTARELLFPYCRRCVAHVEAWDGGSMTAAGLTLLAIVAGLLLGWSAGWLAGVTVFVLGAVAAHLVGRRLHARAATRCNAACACGGRAVDYLGWSGSTSTFSFASPSYTARFAELNVDSLVSVTPGLRRLLEANAHARRLAPTPAIAAPIPPSALDPHAWLEHLACQPSRVLRRVALTRALAALGFPEHRALVIAYACATELAPLLERTSRRHLENAVERVRSDNLPPPLASAMLAELERQLLALDAHP